MSFFSRLSNGWKLGMTSIDTIRENPTLLVFPIFSSIALIAICITFFGGIAMLIGVNPDLWLDNLDSTVGETLGIIFLFLFYLVNYFIIVFFNIALVHCARMVFEGKETDWREGLNYASSRLTTIFSWAILSATVGVIIKVLQDRLGTVGDIITGIIGMVWSIATFFVVPILAYEDVEPFEALKRSGKIMKERWGEALGANFGFGLFFLLGYLLIIVIGIGLGYAIHPILGVVVAVLLALLLHTVVSAAETVFIAATYQHLNNEPHGNFEGDVLDNIFMEKKKKGFGMFK